MNWNLPDDWSMYYTQCDYCNSHYHTSEGSCDCLEDYIECEGECRDEQCFVKKQNAIEIGDRYFCSQHAACEYCGNHHDDIEWLKSYQGDIYCNECFESGDIIVAAA